MALESKYKDRAEFETTKRLLYHLTNERLAEVTIHEAGIGERWLRLCDPKPSQPGSTHLEVLLSLGARLNIKDGKVVSLRSPGELAPPVVVVQGEPGNEKTTTELNPGTLFEYTLPWFNEAVYQEQIAQIAHELRNSAANQGPLGILR